MADIILKCKHCGRDNKVSEYATGTVPCAGCRNAIDIPVKQQGVMDAKLKMRRIDGKGSSLTAHTMDAKAAAQSPPRAGTGTASAVRAAAVLSDVHKARQKTHTPLSVWSWLTFLLVGGLLVGTEYYVTVVDPSFAQWYLMGRWGIWALVSLLVLIVAFEDSTGQGLFCLFLPLYIVYYAFIRVEYYWLRGMFLGVVVGVCAELYYMPDHAALIAAQNGINKFIALTGKQIERVSESPDMPPPVVHRRGAGNWQNKPKK